MIEVSEADLLDSESQATENHNPSGPRENDQFAVA